jgi:putative drug exporter of the RND superfamily
MATMIGLGVGIDYALFLVTRHREFLAAGLTVADAAGRAVATAGQAVIFAGGTVVIAILGLAVAGVPFMTAAASRPRSSWLIMVDRVGHLPARPCSGSAVTGSTDSVIHRRGTRRCASDGWRPLGRHVTRHAWPYALGVTARSSR